MKLKWKLCYHEKISNGKHVFYYYQDEHPIQVGQYKNGKKYGITICYLDIDKNYSKIRKKEKKKYFKIINN